MAGSARITDDGFMLGQDGLRTGRGVLALAVLAAAVLLSAVGVAALRNDTASADTVLQRGPDAVLTLSDGQRRPAVEGEQIPVGATVLAGLGGAVLATDGREVHLYPAASVTVLDGLRQVLHGGSVLVDASGAPGLDLGTPAAAVVARDGALVRVDGGPLTRVGVLRTDAKGRPGADVRATDRRALTEVPEFYQVQVATGGLPGGTSPLLLTGDDYELALARDLVLSDRMLNQIRRRLVSGGTEGGVVLAALTAAVPDVGVVAAAAPDTERALGYLVATSATGGDGSQADRFAVVRELRSAGGSWGVVAAIVGSTVDGVGARLNELLLPSAAVLAVEQQPALEGTFFGPPASAPPLALGTSGAEPAAEPESAGPAAGSSAAPAPKATPTPVDPGTLPPLPASPADPVLTPVLSPVTGVVDGLVDTVLDLLDVSDGALTEPTPTPTPLLQLDLSLLSS